MRDSIIEHVRTKFELAGYNLTDQQIDKLISTCECIHIIGMSDAMVIDYVCHCLIENNRPTIISDY